MAGIKTNITDNVCAGSWIVQPFESRQIRTEDSHTPRCRTHRDKYAIFGHGLTDTLANNKTFHIIKQTYVNVPVCVSAWVYEILNSVDFR